MPPWLRPLKHPSGFGGGGPHVVRWKLPFFFLSSPKCLLGISLRGFQICGRWFCFRFGVGVFCLGLFIWHPPQLLQSKNGLKGLGGLILVPNGEGGAASGECFIVGHQRLKYGKAFHIMIYLS